MMRALLLAVTIVVSLAAAPSAHADRFRGLTGQGETVTLSEELLFNWHAGCRNGTRLGERRTGFVSADGGPIGEAIEGRARYRLALKRGRIALVVTRMRGRLRGPEASPAHRVWRGTFEARVTIRRHGVVSDHCSARTRWVAKPEGLGTGSVSYSASMNNPARAFDSSTETIFARGSRRLVEVSAEPGDHVLIFDFRPPAGGELKAGRRYEIVNGYPGASFSKLGSDEHCFRGFFVVHAIRFDRLGRLMRFHVTWEQPCEPGEPPWTGSIDWRATA
jgi:hypothetical protein